MPYAYSVSSIDDLIDHSPCKTILIIGMKDEKEDVKNELWHLLYSKKKNVKERLDDYTKRMLASAEKTKSIEELRTYVLGNWSAVRRTLRNKLVNGCSAESHVSHVLSDRLNSMEPDGC